jgi:murein DD-endopeptidase MepM/ murein hydrolase activator NlpD
MQFLSATWEVFGVDGDGDGQRDVYDPVDAIWGAANYLCSNGAADPAQLRNAIFRYNHAAWYVDEVLTVAASYAGLASGGSGPYTLPVDRTVFDSNPDYLTRPHHDYPAIDIPVAVGTAVYAVTDGTVLAAADDGGACGGTVILEGNDGNRYTYCHASRVIVSPGQTVAVGDLLLLSGGQPGAPGAGDSTGPHLHFGVSVSGIAVCPQPLLAAWMNGDPRGPATAPTSGCTF